VKLTGAYFDGKSSRRHWVGVALNGRVVEITGPSFARREALDQIDIGECIDGGSITLHFKDAASCELADGLAFESMVKGAGRKPAWTERLQRHAVGAVVSLALLVGLAVSGYRWGLPWAAEQLAPRIPVLAVDKLGNLVLRSLERELLKPSALSAERQAALRAGLQALARSGELPPHKLLFRASSQLGANAFALPGGTVVMLDRLAQQATDDQVVAVLAHELGHLEHHHPMRRLIQDAVITTAVAAYLGDLSTAVASATALVLNATYSRQFELQADRYATERLIAAGQDPLALVTLLEKLDRGKGAASIISTHPDVLLRAAEIRRLAAGQKTPSRQE